MFLYDKSTTFVFLECSNLNSQRLYIRFKNEISVLGFIKPYYSTEKNQNDWDGVPVFSFEEFLENRESKFPNAKLVIFENDESQLKHLIEKLKNLNLHFYDDYIWWENLLAPYRFDFREMKKNFEIAPSTIQKYAGQRKICCIFGDYQIESIKKYLLANPIFKHRYSLLDSVEFETEIDKLLPIVDLILTQPLNGKLSKDFLKQNMKKNSRLIIFSPMKFLGYFPQYSSESKHITIGKKMIVYGDRNIDRLYVEGHSISEIVNILEDENFYSENYLICWFNRQLDDFEKQEKDCDVKISDWIRVNYASEILFYAFNRPKEILIRELSRRILNYIGILSDEFEDEFMLERASKMYFQEQPIYPSVLKQLKLGGGGQFLSLLICQLLIGDLTSKIMLHTTSMHWRAIKRRYHSKFNQKSPQFRFGDHVLAENC